jgi:hypothetical protein
MPLWYKYLSAIIFCHNFSGNYYQGTHQPEEAVMMIKNTLLLWLFIVFLIAVPRFVCGASEKGEAFDQKVQNMAIACRDEVINDFKSLIAAKKLTEQQLFDTFYIPIANTSPQKFSTQYDKIVESSLRTALDNYLSRDSRLLFVIAVDKNGYAPTHNSKYALPPTADSDYNARFSRDKRLFNDRTGLAAARNTQPVFLQKYSRDTGDELYDLSVPIFIGDKHWGAIRIGYTQ